MAAEGDGSIGKASGAPRIEIRNPKFEARSSNVQNDRRQFETPAFPSEFISDFDLVL
jgi:hypothetical protein